MDANCRSPVGMGTVKSKPATVHDLFSDESATADDDDFHVVLLNLMIAHCLGILGARSFFNSDRAAVLNVRARPVIGFMKQDIVELPHIDHFSASAFVEVPFLRFTQLVKVSGIHS
jgi:hypothetical protein